MKILVSAKMIDQELIIPVKVFVARASAAYVPAEVITRDELVNLSNLLVKLPWWYDLINLAEMVSATRNNRMENGNETDSYVAYNFTWLLPEEQKLLFMMKHKAKMPFLATIDKD